MFSENVDRPLIDYLYQDEGKAVLASFCLDAVDQAFAPGVSAPAAGGLNSTQWLHAAYQAGTSSSVRSMDVVELNPAFDQDECTARLAAVTVLEESIRNETMPDRDLILRAELLVRPSPTSAPE